MSKQPLVSIIVPTRDSALLLADFFSACLKSAYQNFEIIINDDIRSTDNTEAVIEEFGNKGLKKIKYLKENSSMAQGRKRGAQEAEGEILLHLDSDMQISPGLIKECANNIPKDYDALIIPEESFGTTFWAKCKWLEKMCYDGNDKMESLRAISAKAYLTIGGHDSELVFSEDKDLDLRVRRASFRVGRTENVLLHNEGALTLKKTVTKKAHYASSANEFAKRHPEQYKWQVNIFNRYLIYLQKWRYVLNHPTLYFGMLFMKTAEFGVAGSMTLRKKL
jgi:glycosyltransferase involved in cell wall biosynthesis